MRALLSLTCFGVGVFLLGGAAAPWVWGLAQAAARGLPGAWTEWLAGHPFHRYVHRCLLGIALLGLWPLARAMGCRSRVDLGLGGRWRWRETGRGMLVGLAMFAVLLVMEGGTGARAMRAGLTLGQVVEGVGRATLAATVVALMEETLFRGLIFGGLRRGMGWLPAMVISSAVYAAVHFLRKPESPETVSWVAGWVTAAQMLEGLWDVRQLIPGFLTLWVAGMLLAGGYSRFGSLHYPVGLHAGWVFWMKMRGVFTVTAPGSVAGNGGGLLSTWLALGVVGGAAILLLVDWVRPGAARSGADGRLTLEG